LTTTTNAQETLEFLRQRLDDGESWYLAMLRAMARWNLAEEKVDGRSYRYLIGGEAFDWLLLAERLLDELADAVPDEERDALLFDGHPPVEIDEDLFQELIGTPKYQAHLNYLYGVTVEEALQLAVQEEVDKDRHSHVWASAAGDDVGAFERLYGRTQYELLREFQQESGLEPSDDLQLGDLKEFTYWLFRYRVRMHDGARVASDTRKGLAALSRVEAAHRLRTQPHPPES
jgi:hypothetical protein